MQVYVSLRRYLYPNDLVCATFHWNNYFGEKINEYHRYCNYEWFNKWIWPIKSIRQTAETTSIYNLENTIWINLRSKNWRHKCQIRQLYLYERRRADRLKTGILQFYVGFRFRFIYIFVCDNFFFLFVCDNIFFFVCLWQRWYRLPFLHNIIHLIFPPGK